MLSYLTHLHATPHPLLNAIDLMCDCCAHNLTHCRLTFRASCGPEQPLAGTVRGRRQAKRINVCSVHPTLAPSGRDAHRVKRRYRQNDNVHTTRRIWLFMIFSGQTFSFSFCYPSQSNGRRRRDIAPFVAHTTFQDTTPNGILFARKKTLNSDSSKFAIAIEFKHCHNSSPAISIYHNSKHVRHLDKTYNLRIISRRDSHNSQHLVLYLAPICRPSHRLTNRYLYIACPAQLSCHPTDGQCGPVSVAQHQSRFRTWDSLIQEQATSCKDPLQPSEHHKHRKRSPTSRHREIQQRTIAASFKNASVFFLFENSSVIFTVQAANATSFLPPTHVASCPYTLLLSISLLHFAHHRYQILTLPAGTSSSPNILTSTNPVLESCHVLSLFCFVGVENTSPGMKRRLPYSKAHASTDWRDSNRHIFTPSDKPLQRTPRFRAIAGAIC